MKDNTPLEQIRITDNSDIGHAKGMIRSISVSVAIMSFDFSLRQPQHSTVTEEQYQGMTDPGWMDLLKGDEEGNASKRWSMYSENSA